MVRRASAGGAIATGGILLMLSLGASAQTIEFQKKLIEQQKKRDAQRQNRRVINLEPANRTDSEKSAITEGGNARQADSCISKPGQGPDMVLIAGGTFEQGSTESDGGDSDEGPSIE